MAALKTFPQEPSLQGASLPPLQFGSARAVKILSIARFCPGENRTLAHKPWVVRVSYQMECGRRDLNSARLSPPLLPIMLLLSPIELMNGSSRDTVLL